MRVPWYRSVELLHNTLCVLIYCTRMREPCVGVHTQDTYTVISLIWFNSVLFYSAHLPLVGNAARFRFRLRDQILKGHAYAARSRWLHRTPRTPERMPTDRAIVHTPTPVRVFLVHTACGITQCWAFDKPSSMLWSVGVAPTSLMLINAAGTLQRRSAAHRTGKSLPLRRSASCRRCSTRPSALYPLRTR